MPKKIIYYLLQFTYGLLHNLVGLFVFLYIIIFLRSKIESINIIAGHIRVSMKYHFGGASFGIFYLIGYKHKYNHLLNMHEIGHSLQNIIFGPLFIPLVGIPSLVRAALWSEILKKNPQADYYDIWFESQPNKLGKLLEDQINKDLFKKMEKRK